jgi:hypothetical protein
LAGFLLVFFSFSCAVFLARSWLAVASALPDVLQLSSFPHTREDPFENPSFPGDVRLPSLWRHIYNGLTIAVAFRRLSAFDGEWQPPIKVDGTFA